MKASVGRVVWYYPENAPRSEEDQPLAASIAFVHPDQGGGLEYVNLGVLAQDGSTLPAGVQMVPLYLPTNDLPEREAFAMWMPPSPTSEQADPVTNPVTNPAPSF